MSTAFDRYQKALVKCLTLYQFIEEALRSCLVRCHATTEFRLDGFLPYEIPANAIRDAALGRLIEWYRPYTKNQGLIAELRALKSARNHVAHMGFVLSLEEQLNEKSLEEKAGDLDRSHDAAFPCFVQLLDELRETDETVKRAYELLRTECLASGAQPPAPFDPSREDSP